MRSLEESAKFCAVPRSLTKFDKFCEVVRGYAFQLRRRDCGSAIVVQADLQWAYDLLDIVIVRPEAAIIYVSCQLGHVRESIVHRLCH